MSADVREVKKFVVVKNAGPDWQSHWENDPKITGVISVESASHSFAGRWVGCKETYDNVDDAERMANQLNASEPHDDYAVCPLVETGFITNVRNLDYGNKRLKRSDNANY